MPDEARHRAIAEDPLLAASMRVRTAEVDKKLNALRIQFLFLLGLIVGALVVLTIYSQNQDNQIRFDRYTSCVTRVAEITTYNATLPTGFPPYPLPNCPPDPHAS